MQCGEGEPSTVAGGVGWWRMCVCGGDGGVRDGVGMQNTDLRPVGKGTSARVGVAWWAGGLGFRQNWSRVRTTNEGDLGLKQGNVATFGATS